MMLRVVAALCLLAVIYAQPIPSVGVPCGVSTVQPITKRIVGGVVARPGSWPWTVMLTAPYHGHGLIAGTGVLIHPHVIVTSAQHFERIGLRVFDLNLHQWRVYTGEYNISMNDPHERYYHINHVQLHPGYSIHTLANDIALIILRDPVAYNDHTRPACLPDAAHTYTVGQTCYLPGWGSTRNTGNEEVMNQLAMPILGDAVCIKHWPDFIPDKEICAGYENGGKDFCVDDIGSPLMCRSSNGAWYIQGLASSGGNCTLANEPGVFEDVNKYANWIRSTMEDAGYSYNY